MVTGSKTKGKLFKDVISDFRLTVNFEQVNFIRKTSCQEVAITRSMNKGALKNFAKITRKHLCRSLFLNKFADLRLANFLRILRNF